MKIIYVYDTIAVVGGIERIFVDKMNYLADHLHHEVYLITSSQENIQSVSLYHPMCSISTLIYVIMCATAIRCPNAYG